MGSEVEQGHALREPASAYAAGGDQAGGASVGAEAGRGSVAVTSTSDTREHAGRRTVAGRNGGTLTPFDSSSASAAARRKWERFALATRRGMAKAGRQLPDVSKASSLAVAEYLAEVHTLNAADPSSPSSVASYKQVTNIAYPKPEAERRTADDDARQAAAAAFGETAARELLAELRALRAAGDGE